MNEVFRCTARSKRSGERCKKAAMRGRNVCMFHGGKTPRGVASGSFKTGRYSQHLPTRLAARYCEAQNDQKLLDLHEEIALIDARIADMLDGLTGDTARDNEKWGCVMELIEQRRRTVESECRHMQQLGQFVAIDQVMTLAGALLAAVKQHVDDKEVLRLIAADFSRLTDGGQDN
ncbi:MAG: hypothetical protein H6641_18365 [Caldilineaceae bacterium]|nr:hypothetical protein [Caldilineaceae bacterium]